MITFRRATFEDVFELERIRGLVRENQLSSTIPRERLLAALDTRGRGWVAIDGESIVGFSMADLPDSSIWALFLLPEWEGKGLGRSLLDCAVSWLGQKECSKIWLSTAPGTRAEGFYEHLGWKRTGLTDKGEVRFELQLAPRK